MAWRDIEIQQNGHGSPRKAIRVFCLPSCGNAIGVHRVLFFDNKPTDEYTVTHVASGLRIGELTCRGFGAAKEMATRFWGELSEEQRKLMQSGDTGKIVAKKSGIGAVVRRVAEEKKHVA